MIDVIIPTLLSPNDVSPLVEEAAKTAGCDVRVIATCQDASAARNRNFGFDASESDPLIMIDDDMEGFPAGWAAALVSVLNDRPKCVMVSPQLERPQGGPAFMMGGCSPQTEGITAAIDRKLPTACIAMRRTPLRFDENFTGSGFEDDDFCHQLVAAFPDAEFLVCHNVWIIHRNERKNQRGEFWDRNQAIYKKKWGLK